MTDKIIRKAFETRLATWAAAQVPALPVAWENVQFNPPAGTYLRGNMVQAPTVSSTLDRRHREYAGFYQVTVVAALNGGVAVAQAVVDGLVALFPVSAPMVQDGKNVWLREPASQGPTLPGVERINIPVRATYRLDSE